MTRKSRKAKRQHSDRSTARYLAIALATGGPKLFVDALHNVVRTEGVSRVATRANLPERRLVEAFSRNGRADAVAGLEFIQAFGLKLEIEATS